MKKVLIITPHFPPSNLAAVHRSRLFAQHLPSFGWEPIILAVHEDYYEEALDPNLKNLLPPNLRVEKVKAFKVTRPRIIGDIGIRGFFQLKKRAKQLILQEKFDFLYIPIPSFYVALLGRWLHRSTGIPYGIDYIDPWVHKFPGSDKVFSRHWFSSKIAGILEPLAVKKASLITGVGEGYYKAVLDRNPHLLKKAVMGAMPYGGEKTDHEKVRHLDIKPYLFKKIPGKIQLVYAGAMLPKAYGPLESIFKSIQKIKVAFKNIQIHFIGTGKTPNDINGYNIRPLAEKYDLWNDIIFEYPTRIPYLDTLIHLDTADGIFILGSTEPHYTPSKTYQGVLSGKPILAILHKDSTAVKVLQDSKAGLVLTFDGEKDLERIESSFPKIMTEFIAWIKIYDPAGIRQDIFEQYSAYYVTKKLAGLMDKAIK